MALTKYTYSIATDTANAAVVGSNLQQEIGADATITIAVDRIDTAGDVLDVWMKAALSAGEITQLGVVVGAHDGVPIAPAPTAVHLTTKKGIAPPEEPDGKPVVVMSPSTEGWLTWFTGAGDHVVNQTRGDGQQLRLTFTQAETKEVAIQMIEPVEIHDGQLFYTSSDWSPDDRWNFFVRMPATTTAPNAGLGNCNLTDVGGFNIITPASGDGSHDIDLAQAVPVPSSAGYWDVDLITGAVSPSATPGSAEWDLFDVQIQSYFMRNMPMGNPLGVFDIDTYKAEWISERWLMVLEIVRNTVGAGTFEASAWLMFFREKTT